jgi:Ca2+:H+ antiporter
MPETAVQPGAPARQASGSFWSIAWVGMLALVPVSLLLKYVLPVAPVWVFITAVLAIAPLADWVRRATEQLARRAGPAVGGLLNVTFGNMPELVLALFVLAAGQADVVKGQITGSIIGNSLLGLGLAVVVGTWGCARATFPRENAGLLSSLLILVVIALLVPAMFDYTERGLYHDPDPNQLDEYLSVGVSVVLILVYAANMIYTFWTHRDVFAEAKEHEPASWSLGWSLSVLGLATVGTAVESELVSGALEGTAGSLGLTPFFLGVVVLAVVGNAAEYVAAVAFARGGSLGLSLAITVGSTIQVALLVAPLLVLLSYPLAHPMNLVFANPLELIAIAAVAFVVNAIAHDGQATWFEGVLLLAVYVILALAFYFVKP